MKPTKTLIEALYSAAHHLRTKPEDYCWDWAPKCNCGILAQELLKTDANGVRGLIVDADVCRDKGLCGRTWTSRADRDFCHLTGLPQTKLFQLLVAYGLDEEDFHTIEFKAGKDPETVADWFEKQAQELEKRRHAK